jgi:predicted  nucleic acid-binding Zn-ribbon protein
MKTLDDLRSERADLANEWDSLDSQIEELEDEKHGIERGIEAIDEQIAALERLAGYAKHDGAVEIVHVQMTPELQDLAAQARGKSWDELRDLNARYERIALQHAVIAEVQA